MTERENQTLTAPGVDTIGTSITSERRRVPWSNRPLRVFGALALAITTPVAVHTISNNSETCLQQVDSSTNPFTFKSPSGGDVFAIRDDGKKRFDQLSDPVEKVTISIYDADEAREVLWGGAEVTGKVQLNPDGPHEVFGGETVMDGHDVRLILVHDTEILKIDHC